MKSDIYGNPIFQEPITSVINIKGQSYMLHWITLMELQGCTSITITNYR